MKAFVSAIAAGLTLAAPALADDWRPTRPITMVVGFAAGGPVDTVGREIAQRMAEHLGQPVLVENIGGAGGLAAVNRVGNADPDGHTIFFAAAGNVVIRPLVDRNTAPIELLAPVSLVSRSPHVLVVPTDSPFQNVADVIAHAQANPGELNYASAGTGAAAHLGFEMLQLMAGIEMEHIPYPGTAPSLVDLAAGAVDITLSSTPSLAAMLDAGRIRIIGVTDEGPDNRGAPLISDTVPDYGYTVWYGVMAPAGTPAEAIAGLNAAIRAAVADEDLQARLVEQNTALAASTPEEMGEYMARDTERWRVIIEAANVVID